MKITISIGGKKFKSRREKEQDCFEQLQHHVKQNPVVEVITLRKAFDIFIAGKKDSYAASTLSKYEHLRDKHFESIMDDAVGSLTNKSIQEAFNNEVAKGWSKKTIKSYKTCLKNVLAEVRPGFEFDISIEPDNGWA